MGFSIILKHFLQHGFPCSQPENIGYVVSTELTLAIIDHSL